MFTVFIVVFCVLVYTWLVYPAIMVLLGRRSAVPRPLTSGQEPVPSVAVIFSAHNEEKVIGSRLANLLALDYPSDRLSIYVGVDGSDDRTESIAREWAYIDARIQVTSHSPCQGKTAMLKRLVREVSSLESCVSGQEKGRVSSRQVAAWSNHRTKDPVVSSLTTEQPNNLTTAALLVFTDANTMFSPNAVNKLVAPFADPGIGGVCGRLEFHARDDAKPKHGTSDTVRATSSGTDEPTYWNVETLMKTAESRLDSCLGANGAIYAIRRELFPMDMPDNTIIDDFVIGMKVREHRKRMVYEPAAVAREDLPESVSDEWRRRVRIGAGAYQALHLCRACLSLRYGVFAWMFWSHKVLRWITPHLVMVVLVAGGWLLGSWMWRSEAWVVNLTAVGVVGVFLLGLILSEVLRPFRKLTDLLWYFCVMQAALFAGFLRYCRGNLRGSWERTAR